MSCWARIIACATEISTAVLKSCAYTLRLKDALLRHFSRIGNPVTSFERLNGVLPCNRTPSFLKARHSRMLLSGIQARPMVDPRFKHSGVTTVRTLINFYTTLQH